MKNSMKRVLSILLAAAMLLGMSVTSFAAENPDAGESQAILRGPAKPITNVSLEQKKWNGAEKRYYFMIREDGIGPGTVTFDNTKLVEYDREPLYKGFDRTEVVGWEIYYKSPRVYSAGTYRFAASFVSQGKVWSLKKDLHVTEDMLQ